MYREEEDRISCNPCATPRLIGAPISGDGITIPTPVFVGITVFFITLFLAPAILATTKGGRDYLERAAKQKFAVG